jgi:DegV family protein with EDD domain
LNLGTKIVVDSSCGIDPQLAKEMDIEILPMPIQLGGQSYLDGVDISREEFYQRVRAGELAKTSSPSPGAFIEVWQRHLDAGNRVIQVLLAGRASASVEVARGLALDMAPDRIDVVDSQALTYLEAFVALAGAKVLKAGGSHEEALAAIQAVPQNQFAYITMPTLSYLKASGRVTKGQAILASMLNIKIVLRYAVGELEVVDKIRSFSQAVKKVETLALEGWAGRSCDVALMHCDCLALAEEVRDNLATKMTWNSIVIGDAGPIIASHIGPGTIVVVVKLI